MTIGTGNLTADERVVGGMIANALHCVWQASPSLRGIAGPFGGLAPAGTPWPYCAASLVHCTHYRTTSTSEFWRAVVDFSLYGSSYQDADVACRAVGDVLDAALPALPVGRVLSTRRTMEDVGQVDHRVWRGWLSYAITARMPRRG
jgi:hypothetical protein